MVFFDEDDADDFVTGRWTVVIVIPASDTQQQIRSQQIKSSRCLLFKREATAFWLFKVHLAITASIPAVKMIRPCRDVLVNEAGMRPPGLLLFRGDLAEDGGCRKISNAVMHPPGQLMSASVSTTLAQHSCNTV